MGSGYVFSREAGRAVVFDAWDRRFSAYVVERDIAISSPSGACSTHLISIKLRSERQNVGWAGGRWVELWRGAAGRRVSAWA